MKVLMISFIVALLVSVCGIFIGLQVSPLLANIILFPAIIITKLLLVSFGDLALTFKLTLLVVSSFIWALIIYILVSLLAKKA